MSLHFFRDQCVPAEITNTLRQGGHQVTLLREVLPIRSLDPVVIVSQLEGQAGRARREPPPPVLSTHS